MQAYQEPLLTDADRQDAIVLIKPVLSQDLELRMAAYLNLENVLNLRASSQAWRQVLHNLAEPQLSAARALGAITTRQDLQRALLTAQPFLKATVKRRLAKIDHAESCARHSSCVSKWFMIMAIGGLFGGAFLMALGKHKHIPQAMVAGIAVIVLGAAACIVGVGFDRLEERYGRVLDQAKVPRPREAGVGHDNPFAYGLI
jgi:hypothetical protein